MRRTQSYTVMPWTGGINTSVDPGVLNPQELVQADNVQFSSSGARIKRESLEYLDSDLEAPDFRSSSGTTRTLKWTTSALVNLASLNERLVVGEKINVSGVTNYGALAASILTRTSIPQVQTVLCVGDTAGSLAGKYFLLSAGDDGFDYYVWFTVSGVGVDPAITGRTGINVVISTGDSASTVASAVNTVIDAHASFASSVSTATVTITNVLGGLTEDASAGTSGFTVTVTTKGGHSITYTGSSSLSESSTAAGAIEVERASKVISITDYWRYASGESKSQIIVYATNNFQLFTLDDAGRRVQIHGQEQVSTVVCAAASTLTTGDYFLINGPNNLTNYYVWYNIDAGGGDPAVANRTAIPVAVAAADTPAQVATKTQLAIDATALTATVDSATVTITNPSSGLANRTADFNTGFTFATTHYGATNPVNSVSQICTGVIDEDLVMSFSGIGNYMVQYNPTDNAKYQLLVPNINGAEAFPDPSFFFQHLGRMWCNDKTNRDRLHYSETFDKTLWLGFGDSGAMDVAPGDGDPEGITNAYVYKGMLVVAKKASRHRIVGDSPENFIRETMSSGLGNEGPLAIPVDEQDVIFMSRRGIHSQRATDTYGDVDAAYLSKDIKGSFLEFEAEQLKYSQGTYIPELNSIAISIAEDGDSDPENLWLYNLEVEVPGKDRPGAWYRWPGISCTALSRRFINSKYKIMIGTANGRVISAQNEGDFSDFGVDGIPFKVKTGTLYPGGDPNSIKMFKKITMIYRPKGNFTFTVKAVIDNLKSQSFSFNQISGLDLLGTTFILGNSILGSSNTLAPFTFIMEGHGRGLSLEVSQPSANEQVEIWGFVIEYEEAGLRQSADEESESA